MRAAHQRISVDSDELVSRSEPTILNKQGERHSIEKGYLCPKPSPATQTLISPCNYPSTLREAASEQPQPLGKVPMADLPRVSLPTYFVTVPIWQKLLDINHGPIRPVGSTTDCQPQARGVCYRNALDS